MNRARKHIVCMLCMAFCVIVLSGFLSAAFAVDSPLVGTWGYVVLEHRNDGSWGSTAGKSIFYPNGTGTDEYCSNDEGNPHCKIKEFTYSAAENQDGSITLTQIYVDGTQILKYVLSDNKSIAIVDGSSDMTAQVIALAIKMDPLKTCTNADLSGEGFGIGYGYDSAGTIWFGNFVSWAVDQFFNGDGNCPFTMTFNVDGTILDGSFPCAYSMNPNCSFSMDGNTCYLGESVPVVCSTPTVEDYWSIGFGIPKGDKTYSTADLAGTWAFVRFGDEENGSRFKAEFGTSTCDKMGNCAYSARVNTDGNITFYNAGTAGSPITVRSDGSFGPSEIPYAAAIGNNGNTIIFNRSLRDDDPGEREIYIGVRCKDCWNLSGGKIPMMKFVVDNSNWGMNIYLYDTVSKFMETVKDNNNNATLVSLNNTQTTLVYTELISENPDTYRMCLYNVSSKTTICFDTPTVEEDSAYFDNNGNILFIDKSTGVLKMMNPDGTNITTVATPVFPYRFTVFWLSPNREKLIAVETRRPGDYQTTNYSRLVLMNSDGTNRTIIKGEYLGDWNALGWADSSEAFYYYHVFNVVGGVYQGKTPHYVLIDILSGTETDLSYSDLGGKETNVCAFTKSGNLLSWMYHELYNGQTGSLIAQRSDVPSLTDAMWGFDGAGEIYFADLDGSNFRRFIENKSGDLSNDGLVDISDVILDLRCALGLDQCDNPCADINGDGKVDISDVILTLRMALGLDPLRQCGG
jgi:hypothetical protein